MTVHIQPSSDVVVAGGDLSVRCVVEGDPTANVYWTKANGNGHSQVLASGDTIYFNNVQEDDGGRYVCNVESFTGNYREEYILTIPRKSS